MALFVWDLHGTLERGNEDAVLEVSNLALAEKNYCERFSQEDVVRLRGLAWHEYFKLLIPSLLVDECKKLDERCHQLAFDNPDIIRKHIRPNDHAVEVLEKISGRHSQILISNCTPSSLDLFLDVLGIPQYFDGAFATNGNGRTRTKLSILADYLVHHAFDRIITIGDSPHDLLLPKVTGVTTYLYAHPGYAFRDCEADYRIRDLREVLRELA